MPRWFLLVQECGVIIMMRRERGGPFVRFGTFHLVGAPSMQPAEQRFRETLEQIRLADALGLDQVWVAEHHFSNYGYSTNPLLLIAHASATAKRIRFGQSVLVTTLWDPIRLAEDIAVTDLLTGGRLDIGVGRGYQHMEFRGLNIPIEESRERFVEQLDLMQQAWTREDFTFHGKHYQVPVPITVLPHPVQSPYPPIWVAAQSFPSLNWAVEHGYRVMMTGGSSNTTEELAGWCRHYQERWVAGGHSNGDARIGMLRFVYVTETDDQARGAIWQTRWQRRVAAHLRRGDERITAGLNEPYPIDDELDDDAWWDRIVYGTPERCIALLRRDAEMGVTDHLGWFDIGGLPADEVQRSMGLFAREVMPALSELGVR